MCICYLHSRLRHRFKQSSAAHLLQSFIKRIRDDIKGRLERMLNIKALEEVVAKFYIPNLEFKTAVKE